MERACVQVLRSVSDSRRYTEQSLLHDVAVVGPRLNAAKDPEDIYREIKINCKSPTTPFQFRVPPPKPIKGAQFLQSRPPTLLQGFVGKQTPNPDHISKTSQENRHPANHHNTACLIDDDSSSPAHCTSTPSLLVVLLIPALWIPSSPSNPRR